MAERDVPDTEPTLVERWLQDQQQWQRTLFTYLDSMMKNDEFLMHMGNAMRGSLLAGKPYPTAAPPPPTPLTPPTTTPADDAATADRLDKVLFALRELQGQVQDVLMTLDEMRGLPAVAGSAKRTGQAAPLGSGRDATRLAKVGVRRASAAPTKKKPARAKRAVSGARKTGKRRTRS